MPNDDDDGLLREVLGLRQLSAGELQAKYLEVFGEETGTRNRSFLLKRIAFRLQERKYGGLSPAALARAAVLAEDAPVRRRGTCTAVEEVMARAGERDPRLPPPGSLLRRTFEGAEHVVKVLEDDFEYQGARVKSLSTLARQITGTRWNGFVFFGLSKARGAR